MRLALSTYSKYNLSTKIMSLHNPKRPLLRCTAECNVVEVMIICAYH